METKRQALSEQIVELVHNIKVAFAVVAESYELTPQQLWAMNILSQQGEMTMGQLAVHLHCDASNVTGITDRLVAQNLVTSGPYPHDRRVKILALAPHGQEIIHTCKGKIPTQLGLDLLSEEELNTLKQALQKISLHTSEIVKAELKV